jgi:hypothetical protein
MKRRSLGGSADEWAKTSPMFVTDNPAKTDASGIAIKHRTCRASAPDWLLGGQGSRPFVRSHRAELIV